MSVYQPEIQQRALPLLDVPAEQMPLLRPEQCATCRDEHICQHIAYTFATEGDCPVRHPA